ncbi:unnamed protein product [Allacma fusca]|uniref:Regulatory protein zeste n=1 Tax=Allacma fusca TaxID=39272 RepID=A0A8J2LM93_9HEXA|nr:unnamed protein product [Allacma fusca]
MANKKGKLEDSSKMVILTMIRDNKDVLFGNFTSELENIQKKKAWVDILVKAQSIGACNSSRKWEFVRDSMWGNWKSRTLQKRDNANKTGRGGGKDCVMTPMDDMILDIIGRDTPNVVGLNLPQTGDPLPATPAVTDVVAIRSEDNQPATPPRPSTNPPVMQTPLTRKSKDAEMLKRKRKLQIELLEVEIYHKKLICLGMERQLRVQQSQFSKELPVILAPNIIPPPHPQ